MSRQSLSQTWIDKGRLPVRRDYKRRIYVDPHDLADFFGDNFTPIPEAALAAQRDRPADPIAEPASPATSAGTAGMLPDPQAEITRLQERLAAETQRRQEAEKLAAWLQGLTEQLTLQNTRLLAMSTPASAAPARPGLLARLFRR